MVQPINYALEISDPSQAFLQAFKTGTAITETRLAQEQAQRQAEQQKVITQAFDRLRQPGATAKDYADLAMMLPETQAKAVRESFGMISTYQQQKALQRSGQVFSAFKAGKPDIAINLLDQQITARRNSGDEEGAKFLQTWRDVAQENPQAAEDYFGFTLSQMPGGDKVISSAIALGGEKRAQEKAPEELREAKAKADKAVTDAEIAQKTATNAIEKAAADSALARAQATKAQVEASIAEATKLAKIGQAGSEAQKAESEAQKAATEARFAESLAQAGLNKTNWDIKNLQSQINDRSAKLALDKQLTAATVADKLSSIQGRLTEIPPEARKLINESATAAATSKQSADQFNDLAKRLDEAGGGYGVFSNASDFLKKSVGFQGGMTQLRQEYTRLRNTAAIKSLPPGPATDKDIAMALKGFPSDNASATDLSAFLRGMAKLQDIDASISNAKTDWLSQNNGLLTRAKNTFVAGDYATKPGETFNDFSQRIVGDVSKKYRSPEQVAEERRQQLVGQIPTTSAPATVPGGRAAPATVPNVRAQADAILRGGR
jgi:myosin heavy subunit